jgi:hypothetical protein
MSDRDKARDYVKDRAEFQNVLDHAAAAADSNFEINFVSDMINRFDSYGMEMYLSEKQWAMLKKLEDR